MGRTAWTASVLAVAWALAPGEALAQAEASAPSMPPPGAAFEEEPFEDLIVPLDAPEDERAGLAMELRSQGMAGLEAGDHEAAARQLEASYRVVGDAAVLRPLATALAALGHDDAAAERLARYLDESEGLDEPARSEVAAEIERLRTRASEVVVRTEPAEGVELEVDGEVVGVTPLAAPIRLAAGPHRVVARLEGHEVAEREVEAVGGEPLEVTIRLEVVARVEATTDWRDIAMWSAVGLAGASAVALVISAILATTRYDRLVDDWEYRAGQGRDEYHAALGASCAMGGVAIASAAAAVTFAILRSMEAEGAPAEGGD